MNIKLVQRLLGRKTAVLTRDRYGYVYDEDLDEVADAFDAAAVSLRFQRHLTAVGQG
ncbi:MAG: hypothetical protein ACPGVG_03840 [Mycobacterium sp.]